jgi:uncharacterized membrane protein YedE/YeeE
VTNADQTICDYLRWRFVRLLVTVGGIPLASSILIIKLTGDDLLNMSPLARMAWVALVFGLVFGGFVTFTVLIFRTPCPRCRRTLGRAALTAAFASTSRWKLLADDDPAIYAHVVSAPVDWIDGDRDSGRRVAT